MCAGGTVGTSGVGLPELDAAGQFEHGALGQGLVAAGGIEPVGNGRSWSGAMGKGPGHGCRGPGGRGEPVVLGVDPGAGTTVDRQMLLVRVRIGNGGARGVSNC